MGLVRHSCHYLDKDIFTKLCRALVCSHVEYAVSVWCLHFKKDIRKIEGVQRHATKLITDLRDLSYDIRLKRLHLPTLVYRRLRGDMIEVYKMMNGIYDTDVSSFLPKHSDVAQNRSTHGHSKKLFKIYSRLRKILLWPPNCKPMEQPTRSCDVSPNTNYLQK